MGLSTSTALLHSHLIQGLHLALVDLVELVKHRVQFFRWLSDCINEALGGDLNLCICVLKPLFNTEVHFTWLQSVSVDVSITIETVKFDVTWVSFHVAPIRHPLVRQSESALEALSDLCLPRLDEIDSVFLVTTRVALSSGFGSFEALTLRVHFHNVEVCEAHVRSRRHLSRVPQGLLPDTVRC